VEADSSAILLRWGDEARVPARIRLADGSDTVDARLEWSSSDPRVAYVAADGRIVATGAGSATVTASVHGWLKDSVLVSVDASSAPSEALLAERFEVLDSALWTGLGFPPMLPVREPDGPALLLRGDGTGEDGLQSVRGWDLSRGGTLELAFRLPLTRRDRQRIAVCLVGVPLDSEVEPHLDVVVPGEEQVCFTHPSGQLTTFDPTAFRFMGLAPIGPFRRPGIFPSNEWRHLALVLTPDGHATVHVDRTPVADLVVPGTNGPHLRWYVRIFGHSVDTRLLIRDLLLWEGMRY